MGKFRVDLKKRPLEDTKISENNNEIIENAEENEPSERIIYDGKNEPDIMPEAQRNAPAFDYFGEKPQKGVDLSKPEKVRYNVEPLSGIGGMKSFSQNSIPAAGEDNAASGHVSKILGRPLSREEVRNLNDPKNLRLGEGYVRVERPAKHITISLCVWGAVLAVPFVWIISAFTNIGFGGGKLAGEELFDYFEYLMIGLIVLTIVAVGILKVIFGGEEYHWKATGREFTLNRKNRPTRIIFYDKILTAGFEPYKIFGVSIGWKYRVVSEKGEEIFKYVFPFGRKILPEDTPFGIIDKVFRALQSGKTVLEANSPRGVSPYVRGVSAADNSDVLEEAFRSIVGEQYARERERERR